MFFLVECNIPPVITGVLAQIYKIILVVVPIGIVLFGAIDFVKAVVAKDQDAISRNTKTFITRLITGVITFFVLTIVTWLFRQVIGNVNDSSSALDCALQIIGGTSSYSSNSSMNLGSTLDKLTNAGSCNSACNNYYRTNSCAQACSSYCSNGHVTFNVQDNPCRSSGSAPVYTDEEKKQLQCQSQANISAKQAYNHCIQQGQNHNNCVNVQTGAGNSMYNGCMGNY